MLNAWHTRKPIRHAIVGANASPTQEPIARGPAKRYINLLPNISDSDARNGGHIACISLYTETLALTAVVDVCRSCMYHYCSDRVEIKKICLSIHLKISHTQLLYILKVNRNNNLLFLVLGVKDNIYAQSRQLQHLLSKYTRVWKSVGSY